MVINNNPNLTASYTSLESFKSHPMPTTSKPSEPDKVEIKESKPPEQPTPQESAPKPKKKKRSFIQGIKNCVAGVKKFGIATAEYTVATVKGLYYGIIAAGGVLAADAAVGIFKLAKNGAPAVTSEVVKGGNILTNGVKNASKLLSKTGKFGALAAGLAVLGYNWFKASLNVSERSAAVDHRWGSGHDEVDR